MPTPTRSRQDDLPTYSEYVRIYPNSAYTPRVWAMIRARREALLWRRVLLENSPESYWTYIQRYPDGMYVFDARRRLRRLAAGGRSAARLAHAHVRRRADAARGRADALHRAYCRPRRRRAAISRRRPRSLSDCRRLRAAVVADCGATRSLHSR